MVFPTGGYDHSEPRDQKDKYAVVVANLPFKVIRRITRTLAMKDKPYTVLKELGLKETDLSDYQRSEKLHALPALGDQRPSEILTSIRNLQLLLFFFFLDFFDFDLLGDFLELFFLFSPRLLPVLPAYTNPV